MKLVFIFCTFIILVACAPKKESDEKSDEDLNIGSDLGSDSHSILFLNFVD